MPDARWVAKEAELWRKLMDPRTYEGLPSEQAKVALSWKLYDEWIGH